MDDQLFTLRSYSEREGDEVLEEIRLDEGYSGADPDRPGLVRIMELAEAGAMDVVRATKRDRLFRSRLYRLLMDRDLADFGVKLEALNDTGHRIGDGVQDDFAEWEREEITRRTMAGKLEKARQGKIIAGRLSDYGFAFNATRDAYEVDESKMRIVRRIFREIASGSSIHSVQAALNSDSVPPPNGRWWTRTFIRECVFDDVYKPHSPEEIFALVSEGRLAAEVAERLRLGEAGSAYGLWWYNRRSLTRGPGGKQCVREKPRSDWIAVPVPDAGVPRDDVEAARRRLSKNEGLPPTVGASGHSRGDLEVPLVREGPGCLSYEEADRQGLLLLRLPDEGPERAPPVLVSWDAAGAEDRAGRLAGD